MSEYLCHPYAVDLPVIYRRHAVVQISDDLGHGHPWDEIEKGSQEEEDEDAQAESRGNFTSSDGR